VKSIEMNHGLVMGLTRGRRAAFQGKVTMGIDCS
jgi:hypothetical protein